MPAVCSEASEATTTRAPWPSGHVEDAMQRTVVLLLIGTSVTLGCSSPPPPAPGQARTELESDIEGHFEGWSEVTLTEESPGEYRGTALIDGEHEVDVDVEEIPGGVTAEWSNEGGSVRGNVRATWE